MNEEQLLARLGRQALEIERLNECYNQVARALADVVSGNIAASRVLVNLTDRTYTIAAEGECPPVPATINGLPVCVVSPDRPPCGIGDFDKAVAAPPDEPEDEPA